MLLHVSTLRPVKRAVDCVGILARVNRRVPCRLLMVGDGPDANAVESAAARLGMTDRISMVGATANVGNYFAQAGRRVARERHAPTGAVTAYEAFYAQTSGCRVATLLAGAPR